MSTWAELVAAGFRRIIGVQIEGIPLDFIEGAILTTADVPLTVSASRVEISHALRLTDNESFDIELDRFSGIPRGRAVTMSFDLKELATSTLGAVLFKVPTLKARLTATVSDPAATTFNAVTTSWPDTGAFFIGREYCTYSTRYGASFAGVTRAVAGNAHYHESETTSSYAFLTNSPIYWRGRLVTVYEHLVGPDGRYPVAAGAVNTVGTFCRELWKGYVDEHPRTQARVMSLKTLPIERLFAQAIASGRGGEVTYVLPPQLSGVGYGFTANMEGVFYITESDKLFIGYGSAIANQTQFPRYGTTGIQSLTRWAARVKADATTYLDALSTNSFRVALDPETTVPVAIDFWFRAGTDPGGGGARQQVNAASRAWFLGTPLDVEAVDPTTSDPSNQYIFPVTANRAPVSWMIVNLEHDADGVPTPWPTSGHIMLEGADEDAVELAKYDGIDTTVDPDGGFLAIRVVQRQLMGTPRVNPWAESCRVTVVAGHSGTIDKVIRTVATSSGTGARGAYDTLGFGLGLGIPDDWFSLDVYPINSTPCDAISDEESGLGEMVGGWLALMGLCLAQRLQSDGTIKIEAVPTTIETNSYVTTLTAADVILAAADTEQLFDVPNVVKIEDSFRNKKAESVLRDVPRMAAEGARKMSFVAPSITPSDVVVYGSKLLRLADGQLVVTLPVSPAVTLRVGDPCRLDISHPLIWNWSTGATTGVVPARVIGVRDNPGEPRSLTFLCPAQRAAGGFLCPSAVVTARGSTTLVTVDDVTGFVVGQAIWAYVRGNDAATIVQRTINGISGLVLTLATSLDVSIYPAGEDTWITYADSTVVTTAQNEHLFVLPTDSFT